ncbi:unnamed protein product [Oppiella nova]|uniref:TLC domain-containing protein n=1 Tax=Oppiella nova TaxID=334625 RepID=A0A7R9MMY7_9ACAR|nr:unnamed protein product [Oppiella nova]CAG2179202.1 unnamed protein product [Oppiella nova]
MSYYLEGFYSELIDSSKKKAVQMVLIIFHHIVSLVLIFGSYMSRTHDVGLVMAFLHDMNDIFLDCPKLCHALREPKGPIRPQFKLIYILCIVWMAIFYYQIITGKEIEDPMTESVEKNQ